jgi:hypothetical protein
MDDNLDALVIDVRASTEGFAADVETMRRALDTSLLEGFGRAGHMLENGLLSALRRGTLGFDDLKRVAIRALDEIASHALRSGISILFGGSGSSGLGGLIGQSLGALLGLPGRATGGPVSPGRAYIVGESGPEVFLPTTSGKIERSNPSGGQGRDVRVAIQLVVPRETVAPTAMRRSSRQIASAVRRTLEQA